MKRILPLIILSVFAAVMVMAAAPAYNEYQATFDTLTIDSQFTAVQWELIDSIIVIKTDTCYTRYTVFGIAVLDPYDKLYIGFDDGGGAAGMPLDTVKLSGFGHRVGQVSLPFSVAYGDSLIHQTDANDTIYLYMAVGGSTAGEKVFVKNVVFSAEVFDMSAAGVVGE